MVGLASKIRSEYLYVIGVVRLFARLIPILLRKERTISDQIADLARKYGSRDALIQGDLILTFKDLDERANAYAHWARSMGISKGDVVALHMGNRPEFVVAWIGLARAGAVVALINTNQVGPSLSHSYNIVRPRLIVLGSEMMTQFATARATIEPCPEVWISGEAGDGNDLEGALAPQSVLPLSQADAPALTIDDPCLYIYTSGTTGLPKAATISHYRVLAIMNGFSAIMGTKKTDRMFATLPLYHSSGGLIAGGAALSVGGATIINESFSASNFWRDVVAYDATAFVYIGELCRYLLNVTEQPEERQHKIRVCLGNGLRPNVWPRFQERFGLTRIIEFYAATEGNVVLINQDGKAGSVGRIPAWTKPLFHTEIIRLDKETSAPLRGDSGFLQICEPGEIGEAIGEVQSGATAPTSRFDGYADKKSSENKVLRDGFSKGDVWFRTGDLMRRDKAGYFYFIDRIGDTFRWKGENVSTAEVSEAVSAYPGVDHANVYGVEVPGHDGRAGMAALVIGDGFNVDGLPAFLSGRLPTYARPRFLRILPEMEITSTFKQRKVDLVEEGFGPNTGDDPVYYASSDGSSYEVLRPEMLAAIVSGDESL